jgi:transposase
MSTSSSSPVVETGVTARSGRRRLTVEYKTWLVQEAERLRGSGDVGAFLRREGVYSSQLATWRKQYAAGVRQALSQKRGPKATTTAPTAELHRLQRENDTLRAQLARAELLIDIQKKVAALMVASATETLGSAT